MRTDAPITIRDQLDRGACAISAVMIGELFVMAAAGAAPETGDPDALSQRGPVASGGVALMSCRWPGSQRVDYEECIRLYVI
jgi:hypothetical protein